MRSQSVGSQTRSGELGAEQLEQPRFDDGIEIVHPVGNGTSEQAGLVASSSAENALRFRFVGPRAEASRFDVELS